MNIAQTLAVFVEHLEDHGICTLDEVISALISVRKFRVGCYSLSRFTMSDDQVKNNTLDTADTVEVPAVKPKESFSQTPTGQFKALCYRVINVGRRGSDD